MKVRIAFLAFLIMVVADVDCTCRCTFSFLHFSLDICRVHSLC